MKSVSLFRLFGLVALLLALPAGGAFAQSYPDKPIRFVVAFSAGGGADILARIMAQKMSEDFGQPVVVENRTGGSTVIATEFVAKSAPEGYTIFISTPALVANHLLYTKTKLPYDATRDFIPITQWVSFPNFLVVHPELPVTSVKELIALAKSKPGQINYGSTGNGSTPHLGMELFKSMAGINLVQIPYKGSSPAMTDLMGGRISVMFDAVVTSLPQVKAGKVRALAVSAMSRSPLAPEVPTVAEAGLPGFDAAVWIGMFAPTGTPKAAVDKLYASSAKFLRMPEVTARLLSHGFEPVASSPEQFAAFFKAELLKWGKVIKESGAKAE